MKLEQPLSKKQWKEFFSHEYFRVESEELWDKFYVRKPGNVLEYKYRLIKTRSSYVVGGVYFSRVRFIMYWLAQLFTESAETKRHIFPKTRLYWITLPKDECKIDLPRQLRSKRIIEGNYIDLRELHLAKILPRVFQDGEFIRWILRTKYQKMLKRFIELRSKSMKWIFISFENLFNMPNTIAEKLDELKIKVQLTYFPSRNSVNTRMGNIMDIKKESLITLHFWWDFHDHPLFNTKIMIELIKRNNELFYPLLRLYLPFGRYKNYKSDIYLILPSKYRMKKSSLHKALIKYGREFMPKHLFIYYIVSCNVPEIRKMSKIKKWLETPKDIKFLLSELSLNLCIRTVKFLTDDTNFFLEKITPKEFEIFILNYLHGAFLMEDMYGIHWDEYWLIPEYKDQYKVLKLLLNKTSKYKRLYPVNLLILISKFMVLNNEIAFLEYFVSLHSRKLHRWNYVKWILLSEIVKKRHILDIKSELTIIITLGKLFEF